MLLSLGRYERVRLSKNWGWELNITTRACFHVYDCGVAILLEIAIFFPFISKKQMQQPRPAAPGTWGCATRWALFMQVYYTHSTSKHFHARWFSAETSAKEENEHSYKHIQYTNANMNTDTPPTPHTPHAVLGFYVLCPNFWLVPTSKQASKQGALVYFLAASKYFTRSAFMLEIWAMHGRYLVSQNSKQPASLQQEGTLTEGMYAALTTCMS